MCSDLSLSNRVSLPGTASDHVKINKDCVCFLCDAPSYPVTDLHVEFRDIFPEHGSETVDGMS